jgi:hypothetical protein
MRSIHHGPHRARPRVIDRLLLARSCGRQVDGIWIGSWRPPDHSTRIEQALHLVERHSPLHYARILRNLERIWIFLLSHGRAEYNEALGACVIDERLIADPETNTEELASIIVHEATHARLDRCGIEYREELRVRIETVCLRRELDFAARLPDSLALQSRLVNMLDWYGDNQDYFSDTRLLERDADGEMETLRYAGVPEWFIRAAPTLRSVIAWTRRLFRGVPPFRS